jgi:hypothetical protein
LIAQDTPAEGISFGVFQPLLFAAALYTILFVVSRVLEGRDDPRGERLADAAFGLLLLMAAYVVVLAVTAVASEYELVWDMIVTTLVISVFFLLLIGLLLVLAEKGVGGLSRLRRRGR